MAFRYSTTASGSLSWVTNWSAAATYSCLRTSGSPEHAADVKTNTVAGRTAHVYMKRITSLLTNFSPGIMAWSASPYPQRRCADRRPQVLIYKAFKCSLCAQGEYEVRC